MFCPHCGAKNEGAQTRCFVCQKVLPSLDAARPVAPAAAPRARLTPGRAEVPGSVGDRMIALVFDRLLLAALLSIAGAWFGTDPARSLPATLWIAVAGGLAAAAVIFLYHFLLEATLGTTLGKGIMGLQVRIDGERGRFAASAIRNAMRLVDGIGLYLVGFFVALFSSRRKRIGDFLAGTIVLELPVPPLARAALLLTWVAIVVASLWIASTLCPGCTAGIEIPA